MKHDPCTAIPFALAIKTLDEIDNELQKKLKEVIEKTEIHTVCENNGIGPYEFWGHKGFDKGNDYLIIDEADSIALTVTVEGSINQEETNEDDMDEYLNTFMEEDIVTRKVTVGSDERSNGISSTFRLKIVNGKIENGIYTCKLEWTDEE